MYSPSPLFTPREPLYGRFEWVVSHLIVKALEEGQDTIVLPSDQFPHLGELKITLTR